MPLLCAFALFAGAVAAQSPTVRNVPADYATIQAAIDAAVNGDTVRVAPGIYVENINFKGKAITVESTDGAAVTIIDGNQNGSVVTFNTGEGPDSILRGFTIRNGFATFSDPSRGNGGGIRIFGASPIVEQNIVVANRSCIGNGVFISDGYVSVASPVVRRNTIRDNRQDGCSSGTGGGGVHAGGMNTQILDNIISGNLTSSGGAGISVAPSGIVTVQGNTIRNNTTDFGFGGGIEVVGSEARIINNLIAANSAFFEGGGVYWFASFGSIGPTLLNNTIADNLSPVGSAISANGYVENALLVNNLIIGMSGQTALKCGSLGQQAPILRFNNIFSPAGFAYGGLCQDQTGLSGNISTDPQFVNPASLNYRLRFGSPATDAGDNGHTQMPTTDLDGNPRIVDGDGNGSAIVNLGAFESPSLPPAIVTVSPNTGTAGTTVPILLAGSNFDASTVVGVSGTGVTVGSISVMSSSQVTATLTIAPDASPGTRTLNVSTAAGIASQSFTLSPVSGPPSLTSVSPAVLNPGKTYAVTLTGTNFGVPATVSVTSGTGVTVSNTTVMNIATITCDLTVATNASFGEHFLRVTTPGGTSNQVDFDTLNRPSLSAITPSSSSPGTTVNVTLTGSYFWNGSTIQVSGGDITVSSVVRVNTTTLTANFSIAAGAAIGVRSVTVSNLAGVSDAASFPVNVFAWPVLTSISPVTGVQGQSVNVVLTGTGFVAGSSLSISDTVAYWSDVVVVSPTRITATLILPGSLGANMASPGPHSVTVVTQQSGSTNAHTFTVLPAPPLLATISPTGGDQGQTVGVTLTGNKIQLSPTVSVTGSGVTVTGVVPAVHRPDQVFAIFTIAINATAGPRNVTLTTADGTSNALTFTVNLLPVPVLNSVTPNAGTAGNAVPVTLNGSNFDATSSVNVGGSGVTVSGVSVIGPSQITATLHIAAGSSAGPRSVTVTTALGTSNAQTFNVALGQPTLASVSPTSGTQGQNAFVTLNGSNFDGSAVIAVSGTGVSATGVTLINPSQLAATFTIAANAATGARNVTVTTAAGASNTQQFTVLLGPPTLGSVSPASGTQGQNVNVTLSGTNFDGSSVVGVSGVGVTVGNVVLGGPTQITATLTIAGNASTGARNVTVATSAGTTNARTFTVNAVPAPTLASISPLVLNPNQTYAMTLTGTNFVAPATVAITSGTGVAVSNVNVINSNTITCDFIVSANPSFGEHLVRVTTPGGNSNLVDFDTLQRPVLNSVTPASGSPGAVVNITLSGSFFWNGSTVQAAGGGITVSNIVKVNNNMLTARFTIAAGAAAGPRTVTVTNLAGVSNAVTFNVP